MTVELIDTIGSLDVMSAKLIRQTNWLTVAILAFTAVGLVVALLTYFKA